MRTEPNVEMRASKWEGLGREEGGGAEEVGLRRVAANPTYIEVALNLEQRGEDCGRHWAARIMRKPVYVFERNGIPGALQREAAVWFPPRATLHRVAFS